jgi:hypothetical protein
LKLSTPAALSPILILLLGILGLLEPSGHFPSRSFSHIASPMHQEHSLSRALPFPNSTPRRFKGFCVC